MGCYEREQALIAQGKAQRGQACLDYFKEYDAKLSEEESCLTHRPDYSKTLFAPEHDDIYREFCAYLDQPEPRYFDTVSDPISIEGYTAADIYRIFIASNQRIVALDGASVYNMLVKLRTQPQISKKVLDFKPTCYQGGCGKGDPNFDRGYYN